MILRLGYSKKIFFWRPSKKPHWGPWPLLQRHCSKRIYLFPTISITYQMYRIFVEIHWFLSSNSITYRQESATYRHNLTNYRHLIFIKTFWFLLKSVHDNYALFLAFMQNIVHTLSWKVFHRNASINYCNTSIIYQKFID